MAARSVPPLCVYCNAVPAHARPDGYAGATCQRCWTAVYHEDLETTFGEDPDPHLGPRARRLLRLWAARTALTPLPDLLWDVRLRIARLVWQW